MVRSSLPHRNPAGFSLIECLMASLITLVIAAAAFDLLAGVQRSAAWQAEMQDTLDNVRSAMDAASRYVRLAANDPFRTGFDGITIVSETEVRLRSDLTGSAAPAEPDKGDADGDTEDAAEDVRLRYNAQDQLVEVVPQGGSTQAIAGNISDFALRFLDANGNETGSGALIHGIVITITGNGAASDPFTGKPIRIQIEGYVRVATRR